MFDNPYLTILILSVVFNLVLYGVAFVLQTDKITDISYSLTFLIIAVSGLFILNDSIAGILVCVLVSLWAFRLGGYLFYRILKIGHDDRFDHIRVNPLSFFFFWLMQGLTCAIVSFPVIAVYEHGGGELSVGFLLMMSVALFGLIFESIADYQKFQFKQKYPKQFMRTGLWKRLRHPNYTGELLFWWSLALAAVVQGAPIWILLGPVWISIIIIFFSGIPPLQKKWAERYGADQEFKAYEKRTDRIIPFLY